MLLGYDCVVKASTAGQWQSVARHIECSVELNADASHLMHDSGVADQYSIARTDTIATHTAPHK